MFDIIRLKEVRNATLKGIQRGSFTFYCIYQVYWRVMILNRKFFGIFLCLASILMLLSSAFLTPVVLAQSVNPTVEFDYSPRDVSMTINGDPKTQRGFAWYTALQTGVQPPVEVLDSEVQVVAASQDFATGEILSFKSKAQVKTLTIRAGVFGDFAIHKVLVDGLQPGTSYKYRVGSGGFWSEIGTTTTEAQNENQFSFLYATDSQGINTSDFAKWGNTLNNGVQKFPDAKFLLMTGDLVEIGGYEEEWHDYLTQAKNNLMNLPIAPVAGNHELSGTSGNFSFHFNLESLSKAEAVFPGGVYSYDYGPAHFMILDTGDVEWNQLQKESFDKQVEWLRKEVASTDKKWKILGFHKAIYSVGSHSTEQNITDLRNKLYPLIDELGIDLVLQGHDHTYVRSKQMLNNQPIANSTKDVDGNVLNPDGTMYLINNSAANKYYPINPAINKDFAEFYQQTNESVFTGVQISEEVIKLQSYISGQNTPFDTYSIKRTDSRPNEVQQLAAEKRVGGRIVLSWTKPTDNSGGTDMVRGYRIIEKNGKLRTNWSAYIPAVQGQDAYKYTITGIDENQNYDFIVEAVDKRDNSEGVEISSRDAVILPPSNPVTSITVSGTGGANEITVLDGQLQMLATVLPENADNFVQWNVYEADGFTPTDKASINANGLLSAFDDGTVTVVASAVDGSGVKGNSSITLSNQSPPATSIVVTGDGVEGLKTITTDDGTLQMLAEVLPNGAKKTVSWSVYGSDGNTPTDKATINADGVLQAIKNGTVKVVATAKDGTDIKGIGTVKITGQFQAVESITVSRVGNENGITTAGGTLQMQSFVLPATANNNVTWSVQEAFGTAITDKATIDVNGMLTAKKNGIVKVVATASGGVKGFCYVIINGQTVLPIDVPNVLLTGPISVYKDTSFSTEVGLDNVSTAIFGADLTLSYSADVVDFVSIEEMKPGFKVIQSQANIPGQIRIIAASQVATDALDSDGSLFKINWKAKSLTQAATANLGMTAASLANASGQVMTPAPASSLMIPIIVQVPPTIHTITATAGCNGTISPSGIVTVNDGAAQTYTITPNSGYLIDTLLVDDASVTITGNTYTITNVTSNRTIHVTFRNATVNKSTLSAVITAAQAYNSDNYTLTTWTSLQSALTVAIQVNSDVNATQVQVDEATNNLQIAISGLRIIQGAQLTGPASVVIGESLSLTYSLSNVTSSVYAQDLTVSFDPGQLQFVSVESLFEGVSAIGETDTAGSIRILAASTGSNSPVTGTMDVLKLNFQTKLIGQTVNSTIHLNNVVVADVYGVESPINSDSAFNVQLTVPVVDRTELNAKITAAQAKVDSALISSTSWGYYSQSAVDALKVEISNARTITNNVNTTQPQADQAVINLDAALATFAGAVNTTVSVDDLVLFAKNYRATSDRSDWSSIQMYDFNHDNKLDIIDLAALARTILRQ